MIDGETPLRVASRNIHSQVFDDEAVVLDMTSGTYFSLRGGGVDVWTLVRAHATAAEIATALIERYDGVPEAIAAAATQCLKELAEAGLVVADPGVERAAPPVAGGVGTKRPFREPEIECFTDMRELLLLDPIHEVDETGWPHAPRPE